MWFVHLIVDSGVKLKPNRGSNRLGQAGEENGIRARRTASPAPTKISKSKIERARPGRIFTAVHRTPGMRTKNARLPHIQANIGGLKNTAKIRMTHAKATR